MDKIIHPLLLGDCRKYLYPTSGGMNILTHLTFENFKILYTPQTPSKFKNH